MIPGISFYYFMTSERSKMKEQYKRAEMEIIVFDYEEISTTPVTSVIEDNDDD